MKLLFLSVDGLCQMCFIALLSGRAILVQVELIFYFLRLVKSMPGATCRMIKWSPGGDQIDYKTQTNVEPLPPSPWLHELTQCLSLCAICRLLYSRSPETCQPWNKRLPIFYGRTCLIPCESFPSNSHGKYLLFIKVTCVSLSHRLSFRPLVTLVSTPNFYGNNCWGDNKFFHSSASCDRF